jgi:hypothetical protein
MKKKRSAQSAFLRLCILFVLLAFFAGAFLSVFASSSGQRPQHVKEHVRRANGSSPPAGGVQQAWVARYNGPANSAAIAADSSGNVYVAGTSYASGTGDDYVTIKYDAAGQEEWVARYNSAGNNTDHLNAMVVDASGNAYVTGWSSAMNYDCTTIKYNPAGQQQWVARYNVKPAGNPSGNAIVVDGSGNVYVAANVHDPPFCATIKYNAAGEEQWVAEYHSAEPIAIAVDAVGNVYVAGTSYICPNGDYLTVKYNSAGQEQWVARYDGGNYDTAAGIAVDAAANVYVTGESGGPNGGEYGTVKYNSAGQQQWVARYDPGYASGLAVDSSGNVYVTGAIGGFLTDYGTIKYDSAGQQQWVAQYNGPGSPYDFATAITLDSSGNVYVTGSSDRTVQGTDLDYATIKYDPAGQEQWVARYDGPGNANDLAKAIAVDKSGNVYVTGISNNDFATVKYTQGPGPRIITRSSQNLVSAITQMRTRATPPSAGADLTVTPSQTSSGPVGTATATPTATPTPRTCCEYATTKRTGTIVPGTLDIGNHCDNCVTLISFPFPVQFYDSTFTEAYVNSNGSLLFTGNQASFRTSCPLPDPCLIAAILVYQDDLRTDGPGNGVFTSVSGTSPNRVFNIEWRTSYFGRPGNANFELRFYEDQSSFDVVYGVTSDNGASAESGVQQTDVAGSCSARTFSCHTSTLTPGLKVTCQRYPCGGTPPPTPTPTARPTLTPRPRPTPAPRP